MITTTASFLNSLREQMKFHADPDDPQADEPEGPHGTLTIRCRELDFAIWNQSLAEVLDFFEKGSAHILTVRDDDWSLQHSLDCREDMEEQGLTLADCPYQAAVVDELADEPGYRGKYQVQLSGLDYEDEPPPYEEDDGTVPKSVIFERIGD